MVDKHQNAQVQRPQGEPPQVSASDGTLIPVPQRVSQYGTVINVKPEARITVIKDSENSYDVRISNSTGRSGDTRMLDAAVGGGSVIGSTKWAAGKGGFDKLQSFVIGQTVGRAIAVIGGALKPNTTAKIVILNVSLPDGKKVRYTVME